MRKLVLFGIGKIGQVVYPHFAQDSDYQMAGFTVERAHVPVEGQYDGLPVVAFDEVERHFPPESHDMFIGIGYHDLNRIRAKLCAVAKAKGYRLASYLSSTNRHVSWEQIGENCFVMSGEPLQPQARIGDNCFVWTNALVGHHAQVGDHCWITSGVVIGGNSRVGEGCFLGLGATIGHEISVGAYSVIGAGALVVKDAPEKSVYIAAETPRFRLNAEQFMKNEAAVMVSAPQTILVTGGAGFIGNCFVAQGVARGHRIIVLDKLTYAGHPSNLEWIAPAHWQLVEGDIGDQTLVLSLLRKHQVDRVINFAAESHVDTSITGPAAFIYTNIHGVFSMLEACRSYWSALPEPRRTAFRFLHVSTDEVYGSLGETGVFSEASPLRPNSPYSASKAAGDHLCRAWHETYGLPVIVTHCTNNYGQRQHPEKLIPHMIRCALAGQPLPVYGDGKNVRDWLHVEDHCAGLWLALERGVPGQVYDFGGNAETENIALVRKICTLLDAKCPLSTGSYAEQITFVTDRLGHDRRYAIDDSKAQRELGFARQWTLAKGLEAVVDWYLANEDWAGMMAERGRV